MVQLQWGGATNNLKNSTNIQTCAEDIAVDGFEYRDGYNLIKTPEDLQNMHKNMSAKYKLVNDLDLSKIDYKSSALECKINNYTYNPFRSYDVKEIGWIPIAGTTHNSRFSGVLDGNGYKISGLNIYNTLTNTQERDSACDYFIVGLGLFYAIENATIMNLKIVSPDIDVRASKIYFTNSAGSRREGDVDIYAGIIAGKAYGTNALTGIWIVSPHISIAVTSNSAQKSGKGDHCSIAGGVIGCVESNASVKILGCSIEGEYGLQSNFGDKLVSSFSAYNTNGTTGGFSTYDCGFVCIGGIVGLVKNAEVSISKAYVWADYYGQYYRKSDYNENIWGTPTRETYIAGIVGFANNTNLNISNCMVIIKNNTKLDNTDGNKYSYIQPVACYSGGSIGFDDLYYINQSSIIFRRGETEGIYTYSGLPIAIDASAPAYVGSKSDDAWHKWLNGVGFNIVGLG